MPRVVSAWHGTLALAPLCLVGGLAPAQGNLVQMPTDDVAFVTRHWHSGAGLPQNTVNAVRQTRDGRLWLATLGGLCSYDGERVRVFDPVAEPVLRSSRFTALCEDSEGTLWIGCDQGGLASMQQDVFRAHPGLPARTVRSLAEDAVGRLWIGADGALWRREAGVFRVLAADRVRDVQALHLARDGVMWVGTATGLFRDTGRDVEAVATGNITCLVELGRRLLVGTHSGLFCLGDAGLVPWQPAPGLQQSVLALLVASDGALWVGTRDRVHRLAAAMLPAGGDVPLPATLPLPLAMPRETQAARALFEDREGGVWVGHTERGVVRYRPADVVAYGARAGLPQRELAAIAGDGAGGILVTSSHGVFTRRGERFERIAELDALAPVRTLWVDADGTQWFACQKGLVRRRGATAETWLGTAEWPCDQITAMLGTSDGDLWLGGIGVALLHGRSLVVPAAVAPLADMRVRCLAHGPDGALWIGGADLLVRVDLATATLRTWRCGDDLPVGEVRAVVPDAGAACWFASYGGGLVRLDGSRCRAVDERHGLSDQHLCGLVPVGDTFLVPSNRGIAVVTRPQLDAVVAGRADNVACRLLGTPGGGPAEINGGYQGCAVAVDGRAWFTGIEQVFAVDVDRITRRPTALPVRVQYALVGETRVLEPMALHPAATERALFLRLVVGTLDDLARWRVRWRVLGHRDIWSEPGYDREVRFDLPAGDFVFEAAVVDDDGSPSTAVLRLPIHVPAAWWESPWALGSLVLLFVGGGFTLIRFGATRSAAQARRLQALVDARTVELTSAQQQLEQRVAERTADLRQALDRQVEEQRERERLERQVQQMQRMDSLGQLAGGIAHDFNNLLTVVRGAGELLADVVDASDRHELCRSIQLACERGRNLTQHLLAVASRQQVATSRLDLARVLVELRPVLQTLLGDGIALHFEAPAEPVPVRAAVTQIEQVLLNLATNAREAMPAGGRFTVCIAVAGDACHLDVRDTGAGMPPEVLERAFEPFFSTRERGLGRGLGLATVYGIVKQLAGAVTITSRLGVGTEVHIVLPLDHGAATEPTFVLPPPAARVGGRVLLVEDEPVVRATMERLLRRLGCDVAVAVDGADAVERLRAAPAAIDAVVSDVVMLGLHGRPLVDALRAVRADVPIVFVSGYLDGRFTHQELAEMGLEILAKPIDLPRLAATLRKAMAGVPGVAGA